MNFSATLLQNTSFQADRHSQHGEIQTVVL